MPPKATKASTKVTKKKMKEPKMEDMKMSRDEMDGSMLAGHEYSYFGRYRIIDEIELSFHCPAKENGDVRTWFGGFEWKFVKCGGDKISLTCGVSMAKDNTALVDLHFYCLPDKDSQLPMASCTFKQRELTKGSEIEVNDEILRCNCPATYGVYIRMLKKWDIIKRRPWNNPKSRHTLKYVVRGREFNVLKDFMASTSEFIRSYMANNAEDDSSFVNIDHDPDEFDVFLHALDGQDPVLPAPDTIRFLLNYADDYEIPTLKAKCEKHLKYCHEIPLIERLKMSIEYGLSGAENYLMSMMTNSEWTRAKHGGDREKFDELVSAVPNFYEWIFDKEHLC